MLLCYSSYRHVTGGDYSVASWVMKSAMLIPHDIPVVPARGVWGVSAVCLQSSPPRSGCSDPTLRQSARAPQLIGTHRRWSGIDLYESGENGWFKTYRHAGWIFVYQDVRGRYGSEGTFRHMTPHLDVKSAETDVDESSDTCDTIDWLLANIPNNNGRVGITGNSCASTYFL